MIPDADRCLRQLRHLPHFQHIGAHELGRLASSARLVYADRKQVLFRPGDPCTGFHVVVYGRVMLSLAPARGSGKPLQIVGAGESFGDITMFLERPYYLMAQALDDSLLVYIPRGAIVGLIEHDATVALRMLASLATRMRNVVGDIESFSLQPPAARLVTYLLRLLPPGAMVPARIELTMNKNMVAAQLNLTPETLSRYFRELTDRGLVTIEGRTVLVHDIDQLGEFMNQQSRARS